MVAEEPGAHDIESAGAVVGVVDGAAVGCDIVIERAGAHAHGAAEVVFDGTAGTAAWPRRRGHRWTGDVVAVLEDDALQVDDHP